MDRVKALRRAAAALVLVAGTALILSCSDGNGLVGGGHATYEKPGDIYGTVTGPYGAISGATVTWRCIDCDVTLGYDDTGINGDYLVTNQAWWSEHETHDFEGTAVKSGYQDGIEYIIDYDHEGDYPVDFYLEPVH